MEGISLRVIIIIRVEVITIIINRIAIILTIKA